MKSIADWCAQLACIALGLVSIRVALVERERSIDTPMPKAPNDERSKLPANHSADAGTQMQRPDSSVPASESWGVTYRLTDNLDTAEVSVPSMDEPRMAGLLKGYWRRMRSPFIGPKGTTGRLVQQIGLTTADISTAKHDEQSDGRWHADPRLWGLDEGSYDQREAIVAPAPSRLTWHLRLQQRSRLETSIAAFGAPGDAQFEIALTSAGERHVLGQRQLAQSRAWTDWNLDLSQYHGEITLELTTRAGRDAPIAAWGSPIVLSPSASRLPYNVVFFVVDAMRGDALASTHDVRDDAQKASANWAPFDAWLPRMPEVAPNLDKLAARGVTFAHAWTAAMWTRPATLAMLTGMRSGRLGMPVLELEPRPADVRLFYASSPPLWPLLMRTRGAVTRAIINNMYLCGYVGVGVDTGFEAMTDHRYQVKDTERITDDTIAWLKSHRDDRFALFVNYVSPHAPYVPEPSYLEPIDRAPIRPDNKQVRRYLGEIRKDDAAIGRIVDQLERLGLSSNTLIVVTADHGEALSEAHDWVAVDVAKGVHSGRFTHLSTMWEEAARVPILFALPAHIPASKRFVEPVQTTDIVPTMLDMLGLPPPDDLDGTSLRPLFDGKSMPSRPVIIEGRGAQSIIEDRWHLILRAPVARHLQLGNLHVEKALELYDLSSDPGERHDVSLEHREVVVRLKQVLERKLTTNKGAGTKKVEVPSSHIHLRISSGGRSGQLVGNIKVASEGRIRLVSSQPTAIITTTDPNMAHLEMPMRGDSSVDLELQVEPANADIDWDWHFAGAAWPKDAFYAGQLGMAADLARGVRLSESDAMMAPQKPYVSSQHEEGIFVTRDLASDSADVVSEAAQVEAQQAMQAWGYVRRPEILRKAP